MRAAEVIVACGGLFSPALLMRSGIGPGDHLRDLGIEVVSDLAGVGANLQNHPKIDIAVHLPPASAQPATQRGFGQVCLRYTSHLPGEAHDMGIGVVNRASWHPLGRHVGALAVALYHPYSRGRVSLAGPESVTPPRVAFNLLADDRDFERLVDGLRMTLELLADAEVAGVRNEVFLPNGKIVARFNRRRRRAWAEAGLVDSVLRIGPLRRALLGNSQLDPQTLAKDESALRALVRQRTGLSHHVCGTCRIGRPDDPGAVLDSQCRVRGVRGLRVVDPSSFPVIPRGGMHIPALMAAEKMADEIKRDWRAGPAKEA